MSRLVTISAVLSLCLATLLPATAAAQTYKYTLIGGRWVLVRVGSLNCAWSLSGVPSTSQHPAQAECVSDISAVEVVCENPNNHQVAPGVSAVKTKLTATGWIDDLDGLVKYRGAANVSLTVEQQALNDTFGWSSGKSYCVNSNWIPSQAYPDVLVRALAVQANNYSCPLADSSIADCRLCSTAALTCSLPAQYNLTIDKKTGLQQNYPPAGTEYACSVDKIEYFCGLE